MRYNNWRLYSAMLIFALVLGVSIGGSYWMINHWFGDEPVELVQRTLLSEPIDPEASIENIADAIGPSVVAITIQVTQQGWFGESYEAGGSGIIMDKNRQGLYIITNNHVIEGAETIRVDFGEVFDIEATLVGADSDTDIAVVMVAREALPGPVYDGLEAVVFGDSDQLRVGERAIAIGNPLGYNSSVTVGVISALNRDLMLSYNDINLIQTDAAINPGNSGGALVNTRGEVIGINTAKIADTQVEGIGFAIPINGAIPIIEALIEDGYVARPYLGISAYTVGRYSTEDTDSPQGVYIAEIDKNGAAYKAGLRAGDVIIRFGDVEITAIEQLIELKFQYAIGDQVTITAIDSDGEERNFLVVFEK